jgi:hypothetical protein
MNIDIKRYQDTLRDEFNGTALLAAVRAYSTVRLFARFLGWSTSVPLSTAT